MSRQLLIDTCRHNKPQWWESALHGNLIVHLVCTAASCLLLQTEIRLLKEKLKRTKAILVRQEEEAAAKDSQLAATQRELAGLGHSNDGLSQASVLCMPCMWNMLTIEKVLTTKNVPQHSRNTPKLIAGGASTWNLCFA